jgi:hypothetical protein
MDEPYKAGTCWEEVEMTLEIELSWENTHKESNGTVSRFFKATAET